MDEVKKETVASEESGKVSEPAKAEETNRAAQEDVGSRGEGDKGEVSKEEAKKEDSTDYRVAYEKSLKELQEAQKLIGRQGDELGHLRKGSAPKKEEPKKMTAEEKLTLFATDPDRYERLIVDQAKSEAISAFRDLQKESEAERALFDTYPEMRDEESPLFKKTVEIMRENREAFAKAGKSSYSLAVELAKHRLNSPEKIKAEAEKEIKDNIKKVTREVATETKSPEGGKATGSVAVKLLGRELSDREKKILASTGVAIEDLDGDISYDSIIRKGGKK